MGLIVDTELNILGTLIGDSIQIGNGLTGIRINQNNGTLFIRSTANQADIRLTATNQITVTTANRIDLDIGAGVFLNGNPGQSTTINIAGTTFSFEMGFLINVEQ